MLYLSSLGQGVEGTRSGDADHEEGEASSRKNLLITSSIHAILLL